MVLYLTEGVGGPTLVTTQAFGDTAIPEHGWMVHPRLNRLTVFKGNMLHCVVPGRGLCPLADAHNESTPNPRFRVTFMVALWPDIRVRSYSKGVHGAAMPYPYASPSDGTSMLPATKKQKKGSGGKKQQIPAKINPPSWTQDFKPVENALLGVSKGTSKVQGSQSEVEAVFVTPIWSDVDSAQGIKDVPSISTLTEQKKLPAYDLCFQGF